MNNSVTFLSIENPSTHTTGECPVNRGYIKATPSNEALPYTLSDSITINISGNAPTTQRDLVYISWYFNGYSSLPSGTSQSSLLRLPTGITQTLRITNPTALHNGTYEAVLRLNYYTYLQQIGCTNYYVGANPSVFDQISIDLQYYGEAIFIFICSYTIYVYWPLSLQNQLQFPSSPPGQLFWTMKALPSIAQLMAATLPPVVFHGSRMAESSPQLVMKSL